MKKPVAKKKPAAVRKVAAKKPPVISDLLRRVAKGREAVAKQIEKKLKARARLLTNDGDTPDKPDKPDKPDLDRARDHCDKGEKALREGRAMDAIGHFNDCEKAAGKAAGVP